MEHESKELSQEVQEELRQIGGLPIMHDTFFQKMFEMLELARAFLRIVLSDAILRKLDLDKLSIEPKDFLNIVFKETHADLIYRVPIPGNGESLCIYVLLEHKSSNEFMTIFQASSYANQIGQCELEAAIKENRFNKYFRLSPVLLIIFYHGASGFTGPTNVRYVYYDFDGTMTDVLPWHQAILFDLSTISDENFPDDPNCPELYPVLKIMQKIFSIEIGTSFREVLERLKPYATIPKYRRIIRFLWYYVASRARKLPKTKLVEITEIVTETIGENEMSTLIEQFRAEGRVEGRVEGRAEGRDEEKIASRIETIFLILADHYDEVSKQLIEKVQRITDLEKLNSLIKLAAKCESLHEFEEALDD